MNDPSSFVARSDDPEKLAAHAIALLEDELRQRHGLRVRMGIEQEFYIALKPHAALLSSAKDYTHDPLQWGAPMQRTRVFPHSRFVTHGYRESGGSGSEQPLLAQYEVVTDHRHPLPLHRLPKAIQDLRFELAKGHPPPQRIPGGDADIDAVSRSRAHQRDWYNNNLQEVLFDSRVNYSAGSALQLNFSLEDAASGQPVPLLAGSRLSRRLQDRTRHLFAQEEKLHCHTQAQQVRRRNLLNRMLERPVDNPPESHTHIADPGAACYLENKMPGADTNPYYVILLQLAAIAGALGEQEPAQALEPILNRLEPGLGTRFTRAAEAHPELKAYHGAREIPLLH